MSSFESSKSIHGPGQFSRRHKVSSSRPKIPASPVGKSVVKDRSRKRVWKACERCKIKKIKCDTGGPCKRCKEDGMICVTSSKRRPELGPIPRAYADVLENTNFALTATVERLYVMLRNEETWELDEPKLNERGMPIIHDVARILGCIRGPQDDVWSWPGKSSDLHEIEPKIYLAKPEIEEDNQMVLSEAHHFSSESERFSSPSEESEAPFTHVETATANPLIQQDDCSLSWNHPMAKHQESQQKSGITLSDFLMQTLVEVSNSPFFPMDPLDSPPYKFPEPEIDIFDTGDATNLFMSDIPPGDRDWTMW